MTTPDYLIVGAGFAGAVCAERLASAGKRVLVIDQRNHVGGNAYDEFDAHGVLVPKYGAHVFHTNSHEVWAYVSRFTAWHPYVHRVLSSTERGLVPVPINRTTLAAFKGDLEAARQAMIVPYTQKQWGPYADQLLPSVLGRIPVRDSDDDRYFTDTYQGMPVGGYTALFRRLLDHPNITIWLGSSFVFVRRFVHAPVIYSGPIDEYFDYRLGRLPYRSATFKQHHIRASAVMRAPVVNYPSLRVPFTRVCECKQLTGQVHEGTTLVYEFPTSEGDPYWPVPTAESQALYSQYEQLARQTPRVSFVGRLGTFRYLDMHQVVAQALKLSADLVRQEAA